MGIRKDAVLEVHIDRTMSRAPDTSHDVGPADPLVPLGGDQDVIVPLAAVILPSLAPGLPVGILCYARMKKATHVDQDGGVLGGSPGDAVAPDQPIEGSAMIQGHPALRSGLVKLQPLLVEMGVCGLERKADVAGHDDTLPFLGQVGDSLAQDADKVIAVRPIHVVRTVDRDQDEAGESQHEAPPFGVE